jgi:hypothetical protein
VHGLEIGSKIFETVNKWEDFRDNQEEGPPRMAAISTTGFPVEC